MMLAACTEKPEPAPAPTPDEKSYELSITSALEMNFEAEGGNGVITYELKEVTRASQPQPKVAATCEAEWVSDVTVAENITFVVAANEGAARDTKVVVTYGEQSFEVAVKQVAKGEQPEPEPEYVMEAEFAAAMRIPSEEADIADNAFAIIFVDDAENKELGIVVTGAEEDTVLKAGEYTIDFAEMSVYEPEAEYEFVSGDVTVGLEGDIYSFDIVLADAEEALYHFTYEGVVLDMEPAEKPEPQDFNPVKVEAYRADSWDLGNFELDLYINDELYHALDMQDMINPNDGHLTAGVYSMAEGSITEWSNFVWDLETGEGAYVVDAEIALSHNDDGTSTIVGFIESEYGDHLDIDWTGVVAGFVFGGATPEPPTPGEGFDFTAPYFACEYYSAGSMGTPANNYYIILSDDEACNTQNPANDATYVMLDLYSALEQASLPIGTYTFDANDSGEDGTLGCYYSSVMVMVDGVPSPWFGIAGGTVTVTEGKIYAELVREDNGDTVTVTYEGDLTFGNGGGSEGGIEGDVELNVTGAGIHAEYYMDYYDVGSDNWWITVYEDDANMSGVYLQFDILSSVYADDWRGEYISLNEASAYDYTFVPGEVSGGYLTGSWYAILDNGDLTDTSAALVSGTVEFVFNEDGSKSVVLDCVDNAGNKITGTVTGTLSAETLSASVKRNHIPVKRSMVVR